jgi:CBS domain-containing protein
MFTIQQASATSYKGNHDTLPNVDRDATVLEACRLMRRTGSPELLVTEEANGTLFPVGILTASDIVTRVIAMELDPAVLTAGDIAVSESPDIDPTDGNVESERPLQ